MGNKLFNLKRWLTVADTARHLTNLFDEEVAEADVLQLVFQGQLKLSVNFVTSYIFRRINVVRSENYAEFKAMINQDEQFGFKMFIKATENEEVDGSGFEYGEYLTKSDEFIRISGVLDFPLNEAPKDVERSYLQLIGGPAIPDQSESHILFVDEHGFLQLQNTVENLPAKKLPTDCFFVIRTNALREFEQSLVQENLQENQPENIGRREYQHEIILAVISALGFDPQKIPDGGKAKIKNVCLTRPRWFTADSFDHAWKAGVAGGLFRLANHEKFSVR